MHCCSWNVSVLCELFPLLVVLQVLREADRDDRGAQRRERRERERRERRRRERRRRRPRDYSSSDDDDYLSEEDEKQAFVPRSRNWLGNLFAQQQTGDRTSRHNRGPGFGDLLDDEPKKKKKKRVMNTAKRFAPYRWCLFRSLTSVVCELLFFLLL